MKKVIRALSILSLLMLVGCGDYRFVVDMVPATSGMGETEVFGDKGQWGESNKIALIEVNGVITNSSSGNLLTGGRENPVTRFAEALKKAAGDAHVKAIILNIDSPGGTVTASDLMYRELKHFQANAKKPVVVLMGGVAASGGYYLACAGDVIFANPNTVTGSIGVIMQTVNFSEGMKRIGIRADAITSGPNKAVGNPFAPMSAEHRELLQGIVLEMYAGFRGIVQENRPQLDSDQIDQITDGRVVTAKTAVELGLIDAVGDVRDAFARAKSLANISRARLMKYHRGSEYVGGMQPMAPTAPAGTQLNLVQLNLNNSMQGDQAGFWYLWDPMVW